MQFIIVPTDFSFCARKAVDYAIMLAKKSNATLLLLHVYEALEYGFNDREELIREYNERKMKEAFEELRQLQTVIHETESVQSEIRLYEGSLVNCINKIGQEVKASLVVMGTMGASGLESKLIGSGTAAVIRHCTLPVLAVPAVYDGAAIQHVVLALKENEQKSGIEIVFELTSLFGAHLKVLLCSPDREEAFEVMEDSRNLHHFMERAQRTYPQAEIEQEHIGGKNFFRAVNEYREDHPIDLLVMVSHHHHWIQMLTGKSMTQKMVMAAQIPILILPGSDGEPEWNDHK